MKITDTAITSPRRKRRDPKFESKDRESRKYPLQSKIHTKLNSKLSRRRQNLRAGSIFKTNEKIARQQKGQEFSASVPKGELTARVSKEDKNDTEIPSPKTQKIDGANYKIDATLPKRRCSKGWKHRGGTHTMQTQAERRKEY